MPESEPSPEPKLETVRQFLEAHSTFTLATIDSDGSARATPLFYRSAPVLALYWFSSARSVHSRNCARAPVCSAAIHAPASGWSQIQGVQMRGSVTRVRNSRLRKTIAQDFAAHFRLGAVPLFALSTATLYCFVPSWVRFIDNTRRFGYRFELELPAN